MKSVTITRKYRLIQIQSFCIAFFLRQSHMLVRGDDPNSISAFTIRKAYLDWVQFQFNHFSFYSTQ